MEKSRFHFSVDDGKGGCFLVTAGSFCRFRGYYSTYRVSLCDTTVVQTFTYLSATSDSGLGPDAVELPPFQRDGYPRTESDTTMITPFQYFSTTVVLLLLASTVNAQSDGSTGALGSQANATGSQTDVPTGGTLESNAAQAFVGANATQGFIGGATQGQTQQRSNRQFQAIQNTNQQNTQQPIGTPREIRSTLRVGFVFSSAPQLNVAGRLANANVPSMDRFIPERPELAGIDVTLNSSGIALLTGSAPDVESRRLAANLMRLQPGVRKVENQILVLAE